MEDQASLVLDSYALIGYLEGEEFADQIRDLLELARKGQKRLFLHALHLGEVYYIIYREQGAQTADLVYSRIKAFPVILISEIEESLLMQAAILKAKFPISYADSFAAALAIVKKSILLTGDKEFKPLEEAGLVRIKWL